MKIWDNPMRSVIGDRVQQGAKMEPHQERVVEEKKELDAKLRKLDEFMETAFFEELDDTEKYLLRKQAQYMQSYSDTLRDRIELFK